MSEQERLALDFRQNITITLLSVLAVLLFSRTELFHLGWEMVSTDFQSISDTSASDEPEDLPYALTMPFRFAATGVYGGVYGRYVSVSMTTGDKPFRSARRLFGNALEGEADFSECTQADFLRCVRGTSLYCDFMTALPLSVLAGLMDAMSLDERPVRCMALSHEGVSVNLYLWDGSETYSRRTAPVSPRELDELVSGYELGNGMFAADLAETEPAYRNLAPLSLFPEELPALPVYSSVNGLSDTSQLLTALLFNPMTRSRYTEANGTEVIMEGSRSIRVRTSGNIYYQGGEFGIESAAERPTSWEAVSECATLFNTILISQGCTPLYPVSVQREEDTLLLRFGTALDGIPVFYSDGGDAATVTLERRKIVSFELRPCRYVPTDAEPLLLPLAQIMGIAEHYPGAELCVAYQDTGASRLNAQWFSLYSTVDSMTGD